MVPYKSLGTVSYSYSVVTLAVYCIISEIKLDIGRKSQFFIPPTFDGLSGIPVVILLYSLVGKN